MFLFVGYSEYFTPFFALMHKLNALRDCYNLLLAFHDLKC